MTETYKTITSRVRIDETEYGHFIQRAAALLGIEVPDLDRSEVTLRIYDSRHDRDDPEDERCIELDLCVVTNPRTKS